MNSLVQYDSSSDEEEEEEKTLKRKIEHVDEQTAKMPKLPSFFDSKPKESTKDHKGRVRTVPHKQDSWATFVYCKVELSDEIQSMLTFLDKLEIIEEQHISLSRPIYLRKFQLDAFVDAVKNAVKDIKSFGLSFAQLATLVNDEKTRTFLTLEIGNGYNELLNCMRCVDNVMLKYHKPTFYDPPRFHTSIAWSLNEKAIQDVNIPTSFIDNLVQHNYHITKIYVKMGNRIESISLE